jgi:hypothetical protein
MKVVVDSVSREISYVADCCTETKFIAYAAKSRNVFEVKMISWDGSSLPSSKDVDINMEITFTITPKTPTSTTVIYK